MGDSEVVGPIKMKKFPKVSSDQVKTALLSYLAQQGTNQREEQWKVLRHVLVRNWRSIFEDSTPAIFSSNTNKHIGSADCKKVAQEVLSKGKFVLIPSSNCQEAILVAKTAEFKVTIYLSINVDQTLHADVRVDETTRLKVVPRIKN